MTYAPSSRPSSSASHHPIIASSIHDGESKDHLAALRGASLAFLKQQFEQKPPPPPSGGAREALAAAARVGSLPSRDPERNGHIIPFTDSSYKSSRPSASLSRQTSSATVSSVSSKYSKVAQYPNGSAQLDIPETNRLSRSTTPSNIAASVAVSRSMAPDLHTVPRTKRISPASVVQSRPGADEEEHADILPVAGTVARVKQNFIGSSGNERAMPSNTVRSKKDLRKMDESIEKTVDTMSIAPARDLVHHYEQKEHSKGIQHIDQDEMEPLKRIRSTTAVQSPKPIRPASATSLSGLSANANVQPSLEKLGPSDSTERKANLQGPVSLKGRQQDERRIIKQKRSPPPTQSKRYVQRGSPSKGQPRPPVEHLQKNPAQPDLTSAATQKLVPSQPLRQHDIYEKRVASSARPPVTRDEDSSSSSARTSHASVKKQGETYMLKDLEPGPARSPARPESMVGTLEDALRAPRRSQSGFLADSRTIDAMANAIVASSIASSRAGSRAGSPSKPPPPPPRRQHSRSYLPFHHHQADPIENRPRSVRPMKQTLRNHSDTDDEDDVDPELQRKGRRHLIRKHPNKHHEGDRKRWRDVVTESERKRYEGVWAANKRLFMDRPGALGALETDTPTLAQAAKDSVCNLVVQDIWSRSRLPREVLAEVWDLVNRAYPFSLTREEFLVGMWLIDQKLKGRKLPPKVSDSVWTSVRRLGDIKIPKKLR